MLAARQFGGLATKPMGWPSAKVGPKRIEKDAEKGRRTTFPDKKPTPSKPERKPPAPSKQGRDR